MQSYTRISLKLYKEILSKRLVTQLVGMNKVIQLINGMVKIS
jgi:hypothetical protein